MSIISEFAEQQNAHNARIEKAIEGINGDVETMKKLIEDLQNSTGISDADKELLAALVEKNNAIATKLEALDALTPPAVPEEPPTV